MLDEDCTSVDANGNITSCAGDLLPSVNKQSCVEPSPNCTDLDNTDPTLCDVCTPPFFYLGEDELCDDCRDLDTSCTEVDPDGTITECAGDEEPQIGGEECVFPADDCTDFDDEDLEKCDICDPDFFYLGPDETCLDC